MINQQLSVFYWEEWDIFSLTVALCIIIHMICVTEELVFWLLSMPGKLATFPFNTTLL